MKNILTILLAIVLLACTKEEEPLECNCNEPFFDPVYLDSIHLDQIDYFWNYDSVYIFNSDQDIQIYNTRITYLGGREYYQWAEKSCRITVFNNRDMAVDAMQVKINAVSAPYYTGEVNFFDDLWWYSANSGSGYFIERVKYNTLIAAGFSFYYGKPDSIENVEQLLYSVINDLSSRVEQWSSIKP